MKNKTGRKLLGLLLTLALVLGLMPGMSLTARAADSTVSTESDLRNALSSSGTATVTLGTDITITSTLNVAGKKTLDLNGHGIRMTGSGSVISVTSGANLSLKDSNTDNVTHKFTVANPTEKGAGLATVNDNLASGYKTFTGGYITGGNTNRGGGVYVDGGTFNMVGGNIIGNNASEQNNIEQYCYHGAGGVFLSSNVNSRFTMSGGTIMYNYANKRGGGLGICKNATAELSGDAKIIYNSCGDWGGAISLWGTLNISGNVKVMYNKGASALHGQSGSLNISGAPVVFDNDAPYNILLGGGVYITVNGTIDERAKIGISKDADSRVFTTGTTTYNDASKFISDDATYHVEKDSSSNQLKLVQGAAYTVTYKVVNGTWSDGSTTDKTEIVQSGKTPSGVPTGMKASNGYTGGAWDVNPTGSTITGEKTFTYSFKAKGNQTISAENMTVTYGDKDKKINARVTSPATGSGALSYAVKEGDAVTVNPSTGALTILKAGTATITVTAAGTADYLAATKDVTVTVNKANVTVSGITAFNKPYDGNTTATLDTSNASFNGKLESDTLTVTATGTFEDANVGENKTVTISGLTLGGESEGNYKLAADGQQTSAKAGIKANTLNITAADYTGTYDGQAHSISVTTEETGVTITYAESKDGTYSETNPSYTDAGVHTVYYKAEKIGSTTVTGTKNVTITPKAVTISGITVSDKIYDGSTDATLVTTAATFDGKQSSDTLTITATGTFDNSDVGENKTVTISNLALEGAGKGNYILATEGQQTKAAATITAKEVGLTWSNTELTYTGEAQKPTATATKLVDGDICTVTVTGEQINAGDNYIATASELSNSNYKLPENNTTSFKISKAASSVKTAPTANNLTYNGQAQELVTAGTAEGGTMRYAVTTVDKEPDDDAYNFDNTSIPTATDAGIYYVWYKVVGDENHADTEPVILEVEIAEKGETEIQTKVKKDEKSPEIKVTNLTDEFAESTLSNEEKTVIEEAINNGEDVNVDVYLEIEDISDAISASDKEKINASATNADNIAFFDISLFKEISISGQSRVATSIHELATPLKLTIGVPKSFPAVADGYTRTYEVIRLHEGNVEKLPTTSNADGTITFETDKFSTYALAYTDTKKEEPATETPSTKVDTPTTSETPKADVPKAENTNKDNKISTRDKMHIGIIVMLMMDSAMAALYLTLRRRLLK